MDLGLHGRVAWVTGASGGIGRVVGEAFVREGARLLATSRTPPSDPPERDRILWARADVTRPEELEAAAQEGLDAWGRIDVCVANAGVWPVEEQPLASMDEARAREVIETNLLGVMWTARAFLRALARTGPHPDGTGASLVLIGSTAGRFGEPGHAEYAASKAGLHGLLRSLKNEIVAADVNGRVNLVEPGWTVTPMAEASLRSAGAIDRITSTMSLGQLARPEDIAAAVLFFASPAMARHVTGEVLTVAGGMEGRLLR